MRSDNSKLLLGLGLGILVGGAIGMYLAADKDQLRDDLNHFMDEVKESAKNAYSKVKTNVEEAASHLKHKAGEVECEISEAISEIADN